MRADDVSISESSWRKAMARKWRNIKSRHEEFDSHDSPRRHVMKSFSDAAAEFPEAWLTDGIERRKPIPDSSSGHLDLRIFVGTWNVGGNPPHDGVDFNDWLKPQTPADIYVLGFQEVVPLNVGNVLGPEDPGPAIRWLSLIRKALNGNPDEKKPHSKPRLVACCFNEEEERRIFPFSGSDSSSSSCSSEEENSPDRRPKKDEYVLAASKQMVGIFICLWVRRRLPIDAGSLHVSCVGRGVLGCLGNKGAISISMSIYGTSLCLVCSHLASGEKEGDLKRRNADVEEVLKKTIFRKSKRGPNSILDHHNVIWLGDLNYRLASDWHVTKLLDRKNDWPEVVLTDELSMERRAGGVFEGFEEAAIYFPPTYKYIPNSDNYVGASSHKRRTPAWCDRILWRGDGLKQIYYTRGESRFSDHRPVCSLFSFHLSGPMKPMGYF